MGGDDTTSVSSIKSSGGQEFTIFAKSSDWNDELYENLVAKTLRNALYAETWQNGAGKIPSWCSGSKYEYTVKNLATVQFPGLSWTESQDHSKWAVSMRGDNFCVGDINRQTGQYNRG